MAKAKTKNFVAEGGYYEVLEVSAHATTIEIQRAFERLCEEKVDIDNVDIIIRKKSAEILYNLTKAYEVLTDPFERANYDDRLFQDKPPSNTGVDTIFKEGMRAFKSKDNETAIRFFKECVYLFPHKALYRVHLAIAYHEKKWNDYAEKELRMSLQLEPNNEFAQDAVAKIIFGLSDRKKISFFKNRLYVEVTFVSIFLVLSLGSWYFGSGKLKEAYIKIASIANSSNAKSIQEKNQTIKNTLPQDFKEATSKKASLVNNASSIEKITVKKLSDDFKPEGQIYDYSLKKPTKKTYYANQGLVMIEYENGSVLSYKVQDILGWKINSAIQKPVVITKSNEIIPVSNDLPITMSDGRTMYPADEGFPKNIFPEYNNSSISKKVENTNSSTNKKDLPPQPKIDENSPINKLPPAGKPPSMESIPKQGLPGG